MPPTGEAQLRLSEAALREWTAHLEAILRGLAHAVNNRAAALAAVLELSTDVNDDFASTRSILHAELARVRELADVIRTVGPARGGVEAFSPEDVATVATSVLKLHADHRDRPTSFDAHGAPPVRVMRWMFVRALIALGASARRATPDVTTPLVIPMTVDGDWLEIRAPDVTTSLEDTSPYAAELTRAMGGELAGHGFRVPTLTAVRQREGR